jgi:undecaprenyl-diphosphatase
MKKWHGQPSVVILAFMLISYFQALILGLLQGVSELFPVSSLGHSVLFAWLVGWNNIVADQSKAESFFLSFLVLLHVGTATALFIYYRKEWYRIIGGFFRSVKTRKINNATEKLAWLLIVASIPAGIVGVIFEHLLRTQFAKPIAAAVFLFINGLILFVGDSYMKKVHVRVPKRDFHMETTRHHTATNMTFKESLGIGCAQVFALLAGISRSGITMVTGMYSGLSYEDAARFSFLLATPIIFLAGIYKAPDFFGPLSDGVRGQVLVGGLAAGVAAYFSVKFLDKYFRDKTLRPFAIYCVVFATFCLIIGITGIRHF